ncbi:IS3 family transposase [Geosporobacter ferrireducens]|uniref:IS3 family transposase n=1 Tax=Geosporobacter ferrireducens TaxID=1424294 RepID=UPI0012EAC2CE|nr:IS3 family transposase [Geosporobacter ferrireducens]
MVKDLTPVNPSDESSLSPREIAELKEKIAQFARENEIFKKGNDPIGEKIVKSSIFETINTLITQYPVKAVYKTLGIPRSSYYDFQKPQRSPRAMDNKLIKEHILKTHLESNHRYGSSKIHEYMKKKEKLHKIPGLKRIQRFIKHMGLFAVVIKRLNRKNSKTTKEDLPNLLK